MHYYAYIKYKNKRVINNFAILQQQYITINMHIFTT